MKRNTNLGTLDAVLLIVAVLQLAPGAWAQSRYKTLHKFSGNDGSMPFAGLIFDGSGNLYGTTYAGGVHRSGTVFQLAPGANGKWNEKVLHSFSNDGKDGYSPQAGLTLDPAGNLYGAMPYGGPSDAGVVFVLKPSKGGWKESLLYSFTGGGDGGNPSARSSLIFDQTGNIYGTTLSGGANYYGTVFKLTPNSSGSWSESVLHSFNGNDGAYPIGGVIFDEIGNLFGVASAGGGNSGVVFQLVPNSDGSWRETMLYSFSGGMDGGTPNAVIFDHTGNLYGTTADGGAHGFGTVFELTPRTAGAWAERVLHHFDGGNDGANPFVGLTFDQAGNLYGTTYNGGNLLCNTAGCGVVFKLTPGAMDKWSESVLHRFLDRPGAHPSAPVILDQAGNIYGTTPGYSYHDGTLFEITP
jgi:uncharacterized repeat protein (TIGR03803 family)